MKNKYLLTTQLIIVCLFADLATISAQIELDCDGNVGIGKNASTYKLDVSGVSRIYNATVSSMLITTVGGWYGPSIEPTGNNVCNLGQSNHAFCHVYAYNFHDLNSDSTQKENIRDLKNALEIIMNLRGIRFDQKREIAYDTSMISDPETIEILERDRRNKIGFIGQEMIHVLPEAVFIDDSTGIYTIDYTRVIPVLVNAMQEQQVIINYLTTEVELLKSNEQLKNAGTKSIMDEFENSGKSSLAQNLPNPFTESTIIEYFLSEDVNDAKIYIYNMNGTQLKSYDLYLNGNGNIIINGGEFNPGMYMYTLITDGRVIDTKRMILTD
jgi:hypothetical protein